MCGAAARAVKHDPEGACDDLRRSLRAGMGQAARLAEVATARIHFLQTSLAEATKERDEMKARLEEIQRERDRLRKVVKGASMWQ